MTVRDGASASVKADTRADLGRQVERLKEERDYLLVHSRNLEVELRRAALEPARVRDLENRLAAAEARLRQVPVVDAGRWLVLDPHGALRRVYRRVRDGFGWRVREQYRVLRLRWRRGA